MNTKLILLAGLVTGFALQLCPPAMANTITVTSSGTPVGLVIPDDNLSGIISVATISSSAAEGMTIIDSVSLTLNITGASTAYNGDFYAYLENGSGLLVLLNNIDGAGSTPNLAYGSPGNGMNVTLADGNPSILNAPSAVNTSLSGTYSAQGGSLESKFGGYTSPVGAWTLFIADTSVGGVGELAGWSLTVVGTPDNGSTMLLLAMGVGMLGLYYSMRQPRTASVSRD